jgi:hypothetical protein
MPVPTVKIVVPRRLHSEGRSIADCLEGATVEADDGHRSDGSDRQQSRTPTIHC